MTGWEIAFLVNLAQMAIDSTNPTGLKLSSGDAGTRRQPAQVRSGIRPWRARAGRGTGGS